jgi:hypothetical protein
MQADEIETQELASEAWGHYRAKRRKQREVEEKIKVVDSSG